MGDVGIEQERINEYKKNKNWEALSSLMQKIVRSDLRQVDLSDFLIVRIDSSIHTCGTYHELILADLQKKPVLAIIKGGKQKCPSWLFGIIDYNFMFDSIDECIEFLYNVNEGKVELNDRWVLFRKELEDQ
jgi:nucleoside 2-deoxyribosyltransferase